MVVQLVAGVVDKTHACSANRFVECTSGVSGEPVGQCPEFPPLHDHMNKKLRPHEQETAKPYAANTSLQKSFLLKEWHV